MHRAKITRKKMASWNVPRSRNTLYLPSDDTHLFITSDCPRHGNQGAQRRVGVGVGGVGSVRTFHAGLADASPHNHNTANHTGLNNTSYAISQTHDQLINYQIINNASTSTSIGDQREAEAMPRVSCFCTNAFFARLH